MLLNQPLENTNGSHRAQGGMAHHFLCTAVIILSLNVLIAAIGAASRSEIMPVGTRLNSSGTGSITRSGE